MRRFYLDYADRLPRIVQKPSAQFGGIAQRPSAKLAISGKASWKSPFTLSWSHHVLPLTIKNPEERSFYEIESTRACWSQPELKRRVAAKR